MRVLPNIMIRLGDIISHTIELTGQVDAVDHMEVEIGNRPPQKIQKPQKISTIQWDTRDDPNGEIKIKATAYEKGGLVTGIGVAFPRVANHVIEPGTVTL